MRQQHWPSLIYEQSPPFHVYSPVLLPTALELAFLAVIGQLGIGRRDLSSFLGRVGSSELDLQKAPCPGGRKGLRQSRLKEQPIARGGRTRKQWAVCGVSLVRVGLGLWKTVVD